MWAQDLLSYYSARKIRSDSYIDISMIVVIVGANDHAVLLQEFLWIMIEKLMISWDYFCMYLPLWRKMSASINIPIFNNVYRSAMDYIHLIDWCQTVPYQFLREEIENNLPKFVTSTNRLKQIDKIPQSRMYAFNCKGMTSIGGENGSPTQKHPPKSIELILLAPIQIVQWAILPSIVPTTLSAHWLYNSLLRTHVCNVRNHCPSRK